MDANIGQAFYLGLHVARRVHGGGRKTRVSADKILETLRELVSGDLTLVDTPAEAVAMLPPGMPESLTKRLSPLLNESRRNERAIATMILREFDERLNRVP